MGRGLLTRWLLVAAALVVSACDSSSPVAGYMQDPAAVTRGRRVFAGTCGGYCHKLIPGQTSIPYLFDCKWRRGGSDRAIYATISQGIPNTPMIGFGGKLPGGDDDIWKIIAYLRVNSACGE